MSRYSNLKPCPFCGGDVNFGYFAATPNIDCPKCEYGRDFEYEVGKPMTDTDAIAAWNTRAQLDMKTKD
jgi:hypothetical protein